MSSNDITLSEIAQLFDRIRELEDELTLLRRDFDHQTVLTPEQAAEYAHKSANTVRLWCRKGMKHEHNGTRVLIRLDALKEWLAG